MEPALAPLYETLRLNTRLFLNCLEGVGDGPANVRPSPEVNSLAFVALHLVDSRHFVARMTGAEAPPNPFGELLEKVRGIDELSEVPPLAQIREAWVRVSAALEARLGGLTADELAVEAPMRFPVDDPSVLGGLAFLAQHDAYHVGQMAFLRKWLGCGPMRYS
jgi:uncharacterized damage-inducible protein DinB